MKQTFTLNGNFPMINLDCVIRSGVVPSDSLVKQTLDRHAEQFAPSSSS